MWINYNKEVEAMEEINNRKSNPQIDLETVICLGTGLGLGFIFGLALNNILIGLLIGACIGYYYVVMDDNNDNNE